MMRKPASRLGAVALLVGSLGRGSAAAANAATAAAETFRFPQSFAWGASTAAYQIEGGWTSGRRGLSIWDAFSHTPGKIKGGHTGDVATDHFNRFRADVRLMAQMQIKYYRFSISWPRVMPGGTGTVNEEGVRFYSTLIDELLRNGIHPVVTLYHWDLPLPLQLEKEGWISPHTASAFVSYATVCFERFGDRVRHWITLNEPAVQAVYGHARGEHAPGRSLRPTTEPYLVVHYMLLAHAYTAERYRRQFAPTQKGLISIALNSDWREPLTEVPADLAAAQRSMEFNLGWLADPLYFGDYPASMRERLGSRLPSFTEEQRRLLVNSTDFFALQHYSSMMVSDSPPKAQTASPSAFYADEAVRWHATPGTQKNSLGWDIAPFGIYKLAKWVQRRYSPSGGIVITENGLPLREENAEQARRDTARVCYLKLYLRQLSKAMREGVDVRGYFVWSLLDNFEWAEGNAARFGLVYVDYSTLARVPKGSATWYSRLAQSGSFAMANAECNTSSSVTPRFKAEAADLQRVLNASNSVSASPQLTQQLLLRTARLALLAEMQARFEAEQGDFDLMRYWSDKALKFKAGAQKQRQQLLRWQQAQAQAAQQARQEKALRQPEARGADAGRGGLGSLPLRTVELSTPLSAEGTLDDGLDGGLDGESLDDVASSPEGLARASEQALLEQALQGELLLEEQSLQGGSLEGQSLAQGRSETLEQFSRSDSRLQQAVVEATMVDGEVEMRHEAPAELDETSRERAPL